MSSYKSWTFNGISPAIGAYTLTNNGEVFGAVGVNPEMGTPPEDYGYTGVADLDIRKDTRTVVGIQDKEVGYSVTQVSSSMGLTGISSSGFTNKKHGF